MPQFRRVVGSSFSFSPISECDAIVPANFKRAIKSILDAYDYALLGEHKRLQITPVLPLRCRRVLSLYGLDYYRCVLRRLSADKRDHRSN